jgi:competence protein ComEA
MGSKESRVRRFFLLTAMAVLSMLFSADAMAAQPKTGPKAATPAKNVFPLLPPGPGRDVVVRVCSQCHTPERAATQRHDLKGWNAILDEMVNNGATASDAEFDQIAAYLTKSFPPGKK